MAEVRERVPLRLPADLARRLRVLVALTGRSANQLLTEAADAYVPSAAVLAARVNPEGSKSDEHAR
jgi:hypothetical protein